MNDNVFLKSKNGLSNGGLSATSDAFLTVNSALSKTSSAPIPDNFSFANQQTSDAELRDNVNNILASDLQLTEELEQRLKKLLTEGVASSESAPPSVSNNLPQRGGTKSYRIAEGSSGGKNKRSIKNYITESPDVSVSLSGSSDGMTYIDAPFDETSMGDSDSPSGPKKVRANDPLKPHREFVAHIQKVMGAKGGPILQVFAKLYKDEAKKKLPNGTSIEQTDKAKELFDDDSKDGRNAKYKKAKELLEKKRSDKKK